MIDDIVSISDIEPGDLLFFHGKGNGHVADFVTPLVVSAQFFLNRGAWTPGYVHTAICYRHISEKIQLIHLKELAGCNGDIIIDKERDLDQHPFRKPILIIRPPKDIRDNIIAIANHDSVKQIHISKKAYYNSIFGRSMPSSPIKATCLKDGCTCVSFVTNVVQLAYQSVIDGPFPLSTEIAPVKFLYHMDRLKETEEFDRWKIFLAPYFSNNINKQTMVDYIVKYVEHYMDTLTSRPFTHGTHTKRQRLNDVIQSFNKESLDGLTMLGQARKLLELIKPAMEQPRFIGKSSSYSKLSKSLYKITGGVALR